MAGYRGDAARKDRGEDVAGHKSTVCKMGKVNVLPALKYSLSLGVAVR